MNRKTTKFLLNVPVDNNYLGEPDIMIEVEATQCKEGVHVEFNGITTVILLLVADWHCLYKLAQEVAKKRIANNVPDETSDNFLALDTAFAEAQKQWEANIEVNGNGILSYTTINGE